MTGRAWQQQGRRNKRAFLLSRGRNVGQAVPARRRGRWQSCRCRPQPPLPACQHLGLSRSVLGLCGRREMAGAAVAALWLQEAG